MRLSISTDPLDVAMAIHRIVVDQRHANRHEIMISAISGDGAFEIVRGEVGVVKIGAGLDWYVGATRAVMLGAIDMYGDEYIKHWWEWSHFFSSIFGYDPNMPHWKSALRRWEPTGHGRMALAAAMAAAEHT